MKATTDEAGRIGSVAPSVLGKGPAMPRFGRHVLFVHSSDELYGADRMLLEMIAALPEGVTVTVWLPTDLAHPEQSLCAELTARGIAVEHVDLPVLRRAYLKPRGLLALAGRARRFRSGLKADRPDVLYCATSAMFVCGAVARTARVPQLIGHVQEIWSGAEGKALGLLARSCHRLIAISDPVAASLPAALATRTVVVPNGTPDPGRPAPWPRGDSLTYLIGSRWNAWKGHRTLLRAWRDAGQPGRLVVLGGPPPSGEAVDVPALVQEWGLSDSVDIVGEVPSIGPALDTADVVVMPSDSPEPFGLVAIEAFARGRPVIASAGGGLLDIVTDQTDGWHFPPGDHGALAGVLAGLDRPTVEAAGARARQTFRTRFSVDQFADRWRRATGLE